MAIITGTGTQPVVFDGGEYAMIVYQKADSKYHYVLYREYGRKLKNGKRRRVVATVDVEKKLPFFIK